LTVLVLDSSPPTGGEESKIFTWSVLISFNNFSQNFSIFIAV
jgi:hypothetical protein